MHMARIAFQAPDTSFDSTPVNVTLVLDASGSMDQGNRVDIAREAAETIRQSLRSQDRIAVVQFSTNVLNEFTVEHRSPDDSAVVRSISRLTPSSSTNVQAGLNKGVQLADRARSANPDAYNYIILMSDGVANVDATNPFAILESAYDPNLGQPLAPHHHRRGHRELQRLPAGATRPAWQRLVPLPDGHFPSTRHLQPRELAGPLHTLCRPDPCPSYLEPGCSRNLAHRGLREPHHLR